MGDTMQTVTLDTLDEIYQEFHQPVQFWYHLKKDGRLPFRDELLGMGDPLEEYRMVATIETDPLDVQYGQVGETLKDLYGRPLENKNLSELYNDWFRKRAYEGYQEMIDKAAPVYERHSFATIFRPIGYYKLHLPFGEGDKITGAATYIIPMSKMKRRWDWEKLILRTPWFQD